MNPTPLAASLLACESSSAAESAAVLARLHQRDRWRMRLLGGITVALWGMAIAAVFLLIFVYLVYVQPKLHKLSVDSHVPEAMLNLLDVGELAAQYVAGVAGAILLAALSTVWLVFASRLATLRQVSEQLAEISRQLAHLSEALGPKSSGTVDQQPS